MNLERLCLSPAGVVASELPCLPPSGVAAPAVSAEAAFAAFAVPGEPVFAVPREWAKPLASLLIPRACRTIALCCGVIPSTAGSLLPFDAGRGVVDREARLLLLRRSG